MWCSCLHSTWSAEHCSTADRVIRRKAIIAAATAIARRFAHHHHRDEGRRRASNASMPQARPARPTASPSDASTGTSNSQIHDVPHSETQRLARNRNAIKAAGRVTRPMTGRIPSEISVAAYMGAVKAAWLAINLGRNPSKSHKTKRSKIGRSDQEELQVRFVDFATAILIFADAFGKGLGGPGVEELETRQHVEQISERKDGAPVNAADLAAELGIAKNQAYKRLREAAEAGYIARVNPPAKGNPKLYRATPLTKFLPEPERVFRQVPFERDEVTFIHPVTGGMLTYRRRRKGSQRSRS